jgi:Ca2+-binding RTX toxin-like protein
VVSVAGSSGGGPTDVTTSDPSYTAAASVKTITLTGSQQHIDASATAGVTITSNNTGNTLIGGPGNDLFHLGRGGDTATGGAGTDIFAYAETPWAGGTITDFTSGQGDAIDVTGLLAKSSYAGPDPFADGYLKYTTDSAGDAQLWSDLRQPGNDGWWLVATIDGVSSSSLHYANGMIT